MRKRQNDFACRICRKQSALLMAFVMLLCSLTACSRLKGAESDSVEKESLQDPGASAMSETDLPEGASLAGAAIPTTPLSFPVSEEKLAGKKIQNTDEAKVFLQDLQEEIGFSDISEFSDASPDENELYHVYRFTQMVGDLPVEGRGISLLTDSNGRVIEVGGRYLDPSEMDTEVLITSGEACQAIKAYLGAETMKHIGQGCVICTDGEKGAAAWKFLSFANGEAFDCYVSARSGDILSIRSIDSEESAVGSGTDAADKNVKFKTEKINGTYLLEDSESHIRVYDLISSKDEESTPNDPDFVIRPDFSDGDMFFAMFDANGRWEYESEKGFPITLGQEADPDHDYRLVLNDHKFAITDHGELLYPEAYVETLFLKEDHTHFEVLSDDDNIWENKRAVSAMEHLQECFRYWRAAHRRNSYDDSNSPLAFGLNGKTGNAATRIWKILPGFSTGWIMVSPNFSVKLNVLAHEFTHAVIQSRVQLGDGYQYAEASAINEGLSDLFSELTEEYIQGSCDWIVNSTYNDKRNERNMKDPAASIKEGSPNPQPSVYQGEYWIRGTDHHEKTDIAPEKDDYCKYAHHNLTVISHMGYLIITGDLKKPGHTKALGTDLTGRLFYNTFPRLERDTDFAEYASILYQTAVEMFQKDQMTAEEVRCVYRAMEEVGLLPVFHTGDEGIVDLRSLTDMDLIHYSLDIYTVNHIKVNSIAADVIYEEEKYHTHADIQSESDDKPALPPAAPDGFSAEVHNATAYKFVIRNQETEDEDFSFLLFPDQGELVGNVIAPFINRPDEDLYYSYLKDTYGTEESDLVSAYIMDFDLDGRKDLLTVTKGRVILANTPLGAFDLYDGETEAATLDLTMYQLDEENNVVKTGAILGAGTIEGHSEGKMSVSIVLQDGKPYICGYSENEDNTTYGARPYVIYEVIEGGGFQYDYVDGISWGQYVMGTTDNKDPNKVAKTYGLDITGTQLSDRANYGVSLCEATANNRQGPGPIVANDYTGVKEGMENGYEAVKNQLDAIHELMVLDAETFKERQESAKDTESLFEIFASELSAAGITPVLKEYRTKEDIVLGIYKCQDVDMYVSIENGSGKLTEIELMADGFPVPDSWYPVKDAVLTSSFAGLDQTKIGEVLGHTPANFSVYGLDAGPAKILAGNTDTIVLRISY